MMRIDSVASRPDRGGRHTVRFSDGTSLRLYRQTIEDFSLYPGAELSDERMLQLKEAAGQMSAKMRSVRIVSASGVSKSDLEQRLIRKGETKQHAREAVAWMEELDLLDDRRTAEQIVQRCISKGYGLSRAKQALYEKRIPKEFWQEVLADYPDQTDALVSFFENRLGSHWDQRELRKAIDAALRRGHSYSQIRGALSQINADTEELPEDE